MRVCIVHNQYGKVSGEEVAVEALRDSLIEHGHAVVPFSRSSAELYGQSLGRVGAFFTGIYNSTVRREFARLLDKERPDLVHIHNLFPQISPSILDETRARNLPTVMTVHNYRLLCPTGLMMSHGDLCDRCVGGKEWWCAIRNCTEEWPKSVGYALRSAVARLRRSFIDGIDRFIAPSEFVRSLLARHGYPIDRIDVVRSIVRLGTDEPAAREGSYVGYVGRISPEKGVDTIVEAARQCVGIPFEFAGHHMRMPTLPETAPRNCRFIGEIGSQRVPDFLARARFTVFSSTWYETTGLSLVEAMASGKAVICSRIGCLPEFVEDGATGFLFAPGDPDDLAEKIRYLWARPAFCRSIGEAARTKILKMFSSEDNYARTLEVYGAAIAAPRDS